MNANSCVTLSNALCNLRHTLRHVSAELALERLGCAGAPTIGDRLRHGIGEDVLVAFFQAVEDASRYGLGSKLWYVKVPRHAAVHGAGEDGMNLHAPSSPQPAPRLRTREHNSLP